MSETKKSRPKHISFQQQREQCRLNKFTYIEKCGGCKTPVLMCNYPFESPVHKKGVCKASTCTDMRTIPPEIVQADEKEVEKATEAGCDTNDEACYEASMTENKDATGR